MLFPLAGRLQEKGHNKSVMPSRPSQNGPCTSVNKQDRRKGPGTNFLVLVKILYEKTLPLAQTPLRMVSVTQQLSTIDEMHQDQCRMFQLGYYRNKSHNPKTDLGSSPGEDVFCTL
jgi:hypothetical protein